jgi:hypothetical protein
VESVLRELDDDALKTLSAYGIKGTPEDICACPVAKYVALRMEELYAAATTGRTVHVAVYFDQVEVMIYRPDGTVWDCMTVRDRHVDMGAFAFVHRFDERAKIEASPYAALVG